MDTKSKLFDFINAVIADDTAGEATAYASFIELKSKELLAAKPQNQASDTLSETELGDGIELNGNTVYIDGKKVGVIKYTGEDEMNMMFSDIKGHTMNVKNNDIEDLVRIITHKREELSA